MPIHVLGPVKVTRSRRVYIGKYRLHHFWFGVALTVAGLICSYHDRRDYPWPFIDRV